MCGCCLWYLALLIVAQPCTCNTSKCLLLASMDVQGNFFLHLTLKEGFDSMLYMLDWEGMLRK